jgi:hypothetical protein
MAVKAMVIKAKTTRNTVPVRAMAGTATTIDDGGQRITDTGKNLTAHPARPFELFCPMRH